ncbi:uncharacterized protein V6R79_004234 [Siganus canaliculatus]
MKTSFGFLVLVLLLPEAQACSAPSSATIPENNAVGELVADITGGVFTFEDPAPDPNPFKIEGNQLLANISFDYEDTDHYTVNLVCAPDTGGSPVPVSINVFVDDVNDLPPTFTQPVFDLLVPEMTPVETSVGRFPAHAEDGELLSYTLTTLTPEQDVFKLLSPNSPTLLVAKPLNYDTVKRVEMTLTARDALYSASTTINVTIIDLDNKPPQFLPCTDHVSGDAVICQNFGYTGWITLNEMQTGALDLKPGPLYAIDGDTDMDEEITYSILSGDDTSLFAIDATTGNITLQRVPDVLGTITLTVMAAQKTNGFQFATTTVTISVQVKSEHLPKFQKSLYEGFVSAAGNMMMDQSNKDVPLQVIAVDDDYAAAGGINPSITYSITGSDGFSIINGYVFMTQDLPEGTLHLTVTATDTSTDDVATAELTAEVTGGTTSTAAGETSTGTTGDSVPTNPGPSVPTTNPVTLTSSAGGTTVSADGPTGSYGPGDMAAVGATLGVLLLICLIIMVLLIFRHRRAKRDWQKIQETNEFLSSLGPDSKQGIQYINKSFQSDGDGQDLKSAAEPEKKEEQDPRYETVQAASAHLDAVLGDTTSQSSLISDDSGDKEVKPILTKERRVEDGYKSVWFKEDIDPDAKEEVVIIPDIRENDSEVEDEEHSSSEREEDEADDEPRNIPRVVFNEADLDSENELQDSDEEQTAAF